MSFDRNSLQNHAILLIRTSPPTERATGYPLMSKWPGFLRLFWFLHGSHGLSAQRAWRTNRPKGPPASTQKSWPRDPQDFYFNRIQKTQHISYNLQFNRTRAACENASTSLHILDILIQYVNVFWEDTVVFVVVSIMVVFLVNAFLKIISFLGGHPYALEHLHQC